MPILGLRLNSIRLSKIARTKIWITLGSIHCYLFLEISVTSIDIQMQMQKSADRNSPFFRSIQHPRYSVQLLQRRQVLFPLPLSDTECARHFNLLLCACLLISFSCFPDLGVLLRVIFDNNSMFCSSKNLFESFSARSFLHY